MAEFSVWAPHRRAMDVVIGKSIHPMERCDDGWWIADAPAAEEGVDYQFRLDRELLRPDPRSRFQPHGVHSPSRVVDFESFSWSDEGFRPPPLSAALIYELHIGTFTAAGTFDAAIDRLQHLVRLGVTHVEIMPVAEFLGDRGWGYDGVYPYAPHRSYGGPHGLARLIDACHSEGLAVILDVVYNHFGPAGNYLPDFGPYFTDRHKTPWGTAVNFDGPYSDDVREYFIENARMWLRDYHFDGLRLDAVHAIVDMAATPFLEQLGREVRHLEAQFGRQIALIAESDLNDPRIVRPHERDGFGFAAQWNDDFHHAIHAALTREARGYYSDFGRLDDLACVYEQPYLYAGRYSPHRLRSHGRPAEGMHASSFVAYSQNHDQVGNRATGERLHQLLNLEQAKIAAALTILSPYVPMLFQGEEWGASSPFQYFVDFSEDEPLASAVAEGRKREFADLHSGLDVPDPQDRSTFLRSKLRWVELEEDEHRDMLSWYRSLVSVRRRVAELVDGRMERVHTKFSERERWIVIERETTQLVANLSAESRVIDLAAANLKIELSSNQGVRIDGARMSLPPFSIALAVVPPRRRRRQVDADKHDAASHAPHARRTSRAHGVSQ